MRPFFYLLLLCALFLPCCDVAQEGSAVNAFEECPPEGSAQSVRVMELNKLKNRNTIPAEADIDTSVTLARMLAPGNDLSRWSTGKGAKITGYVCDIKPGGVETCNCKTKDVDKRDTHIELLLDPMHDDKMLRVVVEVTPRMREKMKAEGVDWSTKTLRSKLLGRWVTFAGWLLFDEEHANQAENTNPGRRRNWRATAWEIHPVTEINVNMQH